MTFVMAALWAATALGQVEQSIKIDRLLRDNDAKRSYRVYEEKGMTDVAVAGRQLAMAAISDNDHVDIGHGRVYLPMASEGDKGLILAGYDLLGRQLEWAMTGSGPDILRCKVTAVPTGFVAAVAFRGQMTFEGKTYAAINYVDALLIYVGPGGQLINVKQVQGLEFQSLSACGQNVLLVGGFRKSSTIDGLPLEKPSDEHQYSTFYFLCSPSGNRNWLKRGAYFMTSHAEPYTFLVQDHIVYANEDEIGIWTTTESGTVPMHLNYEDSLVQTPWFKSRPFMVRHILLVIDAKTGALRRSATFITDNNIGLNFVHDSAGQSMVSLMGNDSLHLDPVQPNKTSRTTYIYGKEWRFPPGVLYAQVQFGENGLKISPIDIKESSVYYVNPGPLGSLPCYLYMRSPALAGQDFPALVGLDSSYRYSYVIGNKGTVPAVKCRTGSFPFNALNSIVPAPKYFDNRFVSLAFVSNRPYLPFSEPERQEGVYRLWYTVKDPSMLASASPGLYIANAFSPGADGINDSFHLALQKVKETHWEVYATTGQLVYEGTAPWRGSRPNGQMYPAGVYAYRLRATDAYGVEKTYRGTVQVLR